MSEQAPNTPQKRSFATHVISLKRWEKNFLLLAIIAAISGAAIRSHAYFTDGTLDSITGRISPYAMRIGMSIVIGFFVGWALRSALRVALSFAIVLVLLWWGLSYMGWVDADVNLMSLGSSAKNAAGWVESQADKVIAMVKAYVPSAFGATVGLLVGFRRR
jgi:uncharacterized membrane protein (Fun14 family)